MVVVVILQRQSERSDRATVPRTWLAVDLVRGLPAVKFWAFDPESLGFRDGGAGCDKDGAAGAIVLEDRPGAGSMLTNNRKSSNVPRLRARKSSPHSKISRTFGQGSEWTDMA